jgi:hypothetical protein
MILSLSSSVISNTIGSPPPPFHVLEEQVRLRTMVCWDYLIPQVICCTVEVLEWLEEQPLLETSRDRITVQYPFLFLGEIKITDHQWDPGSKCLEIADTSIPVVSERCWLCRTPSPIDFLGRTTDTDVFTM